VFVSTRTRANIEILRKMILDEALKLPHVGSVYPRSYRLLEKEIHIAKKINFPPVVQWNDFIRLGKQVFYYLISLLLFLHLHLHIINKTHPYIDIY
jgi:hypothetical protein